MDSIDSSHAQYLATMHHNVIRDWFASCEPGVEQIVDLWFKIDDFSDRFRLINEANAYMYSPSKALWYRCNKRVISDQFCRDFTTMIVRWREICESEIDSVTCIKITKTIKMLSISEHATKITELIMSKSNIYSDFEMKLNQEKDLLPIKPRNVVNMRTGEILDRLPEHMFSVQINIEYDPSAECPEYINSLRKAYQEDELMEFDRRWFGYCLTGHTNQPVNTVVLSRDTYFHDDRLKVFNEIFAPLWLGEHDSNTSLDKIPRLLIQNAMVKNNPLNEHNIEDFFVKRKAKLRAMFEKERTYPVIAKLLVCDSDFMVLCRKFLKSTKTIVLPCGDDKIFDHSKYDVYEKELKGILNYYIQGAFEYYRNNQEIQISEKYRF